MWNSDPTSPSRPPAGGEAFRSYDELRMKLEGVLRRICPSRLEASRDDLVQEALLKIMDIVERRGSDEPMSSTYVWRVAQSVMIDEIRRVRRRDETSLDAAESNFDGKRPVRPVARLADDDPGPDRRLAAKELGRGVWECLAGLAETRRLAVTLHLQGVGSTEAADLLGWKTKKLYNSVHRGLQDLRNCLRDKELTP